MDLRKLKNRILFGIIPLSVLSFSFDFVNYSSVFAMENKDSVEDKDSEGSKDLNKKIVDKFYETGFPCKIKRDKEGKIEVYVCLTKRYLETKYKKQNYGDALGCIYRCINKESLDQDKDYKLRIDKNGTSYVELFDDELSEIFIKLIYSGEDKTDEAIKKEVARLYVGAISRLIKKGSSGMLYLDSDYLKKAVEESNCYEKSSLKFVNDLEDISLNFIKGFGLSRPFRPMFEMRSFPGIKLPDRLPGENYHYVEPLHNDDNTVNIRKAVKEYILNIFVNEDKNEVESLLKLYFWLIDSIISEEAPENIGGIYSREKGREYFKNFVKNKEFFTKFTKEGIEYIFKNRYRFIYENNKNVLSSGVDIRGSNEKLLVYLERISKIFEALEEYKVNKNPVHLTNNTGVETILDYIIANNKGLTMTGVMESNVVDLLLQHEGGFEKENNAKNYENDKNNIQGNYNADTCFFDYGVGSDGFFEILRNVFVRDIEDYDSSFFGKSEQNSKDNLSNEAEDVEKDSEGSKIFGKKPSKKSSDKEEENEEDNSSYKSEEEYFKESDDDNSPKKVEKVEEDSEGIKMLQKKRPKKLSYEEEENEEGNSSCKSEDNKSKNIGNKRKKY